MSKCERKRLQDNVGLGLLAILVGPILHFDIVICQRSIIQDV